MLEAIRNAYELFEQLNISVTGLIVLALILSLAFLFAVREAASWFFKVDDLKRDIHRLSEVATQLEGEIRSLQSLIGQAKSQASLNLVHPTADMGSAASIVSTKPSATNETKSQPSQFPIVH